MDRLVEIAELLGDGFLGLLEFVLGQIDFLALVIELVILLFLLAAILAARLIAVRGGALGALVVLGGQLGQLLEGLLADVDHAIGVLRAGGTLLELLDRLDQAVVAFAGHPDLGTGLHQQLLDNGDVLRRVLDLRALVGPRILADRCGNAGAIACCHSEAPLRVDGETQVLGYGPAESGPSGPFGLDLVADAGLESDGRHRHSD